MASGGMIPMKKINSMRPKTKDFLDKIDLENQLKKLQKQNEWLTNDFLKLVEGTEKMANVLIKAIDAFRPLVHLLPEASITTEHKLAKVTFKEMEDLLKLDK